MDYTPYFERGPGPLVSVLLPTRKRVEELCQCVDSVYSLAQDKTLVEFVLKVDTDDTASIDAAKRLRQLIPQTQIVLSDRGRGFHDMYMWADAMARASSGDWLFLFNDDARMLTQDWDQLLLTIGCDKPWPGIDDVCLLIAPTEGRPAANEFLFLRKSTFRLLGHYGRSAHVDNWMHKVLDFVGAALKTPIMVSHHSHMMGDETRQQSEASYKTSIDSLTSVKARRLQINDLGILLDHFEKVQKDLVWVPKPDKKASWYWLRAHDKAPFEHVYVDDVFNVIFFKDGQIDSVFIEGSINGHWAQRKKDIS